MGGNGRWGMLSKVPGDVPPRTGATREQKRAEWVSGAERGIVTSGLNRELLNVEIPPQKSGFQENVEMPRTDLAKGPRQQNRSVGLHGHVITGLVNINNCFCLFKNRWGFCGRLRFAPQPSTIVVMIGVICSSPFWRRLVPAAAVIFLHTLGTVNSKSYISYEFQVSNVST